jgi:hypothetical protein
MLSPVNSIPVQYIYQAAAILLSSLIFSLSAFWYVTKKVGAWFNSEWRGAMTKLDVIQNNHLAHMEGSLASIAQSSIANTALLQSVFDNQRSEFAQAKTDAAEMTASVKTLCDVISKKI